ncbi:MAG: hypothetical protein ABIJ84_04405 [bacterium]
MLLTPKKAQEIQDEIFKKMTASQKIKLVSSFFRFGKKLNKLNDRRLNGDRRPFNNNSKNFR